MVSQEVQTLSCLLNGRTGLIGTFPDTKPQRVTFVLEDGTPVQLITFTECHPSIIKERGRKKVAGFALGEEKEVTQSEWRNLIESANAVLFTRKGKEFEVEVLKRVFDATTENDAVVIRFGRTRRTDRFIPCSG